MTNFVKTGPNANLYLSSGSEKWLTYHPNGVGKTEWADRKFVARFKYGKGAGRFVSFLCKHFTVEEYFALLNTVNPENACGNTYGPSEVLAMKGYDPIDPKVRKQLAAYEARKAAAEQPLYFTAEDEARRLYGR